MPFYGWGLTPGFVPGYYLPGSSGGALDFDFSTGVLPPEITFTRPSIGTYFNSAGTLVTAPSGAARFNYVNGVSCLLIESNSTNLLSESNNFDTNPWLITNGSSVTPNQFASPDGSNDGWLVSAATGGNGGCSYPITYLNIPYTMSIWARRILIANPVNFLISGIDSGPLANTIQISRLSFTVTANSGPSTAIFYVNGTTGGNGFYGAQLEVGSSPSSYIPTGAVTVTRAADSATFTIPPRVTSLTYTFDDDSTQTVTVSAGNYTIPTNLSRPNIKSIVSS